MSGGGGGSSSSSQRTTTNNTTTTNNASLGDSGTLIYGDGNIVESVEAELFEELVEASVQAWDQYTRLAGDQVESVEEMLRRGTQSLDNLLGASTAQVSELLEAQRFSREKTSDDYREGLAFAESLNSESLKFAADENESARRYASREIEQGLDFASALNAAALEAAAESQASSADLTRSVLEKVSASVTEQTAGVAQLAREVGDGSTVALERIGYGLVAVVALGFLVFLVGVRR